MCFEDPSLSDAAKWNELSSGSVTMTTGFITISVIIALRIPSHVSCPAARTPTSTKEDGQDLQDLKSIQQEEPVSPGPTSESAWRGSRSRSNGFKAFQTNSHPDSSLRFDSLNQKLLRPTESGAEGSKVLYVCAPN